MIKDRKANRKIEVLNQISHVIVHQLKLTPRILHYKIDQLNIDINAYKSK